MSDEHAHISIPTPKPLHIAAAATAVGLCVVVVVGWHLAANAAETPKALRPTLAKHFPKTSIDEVSCNLGVKGLCEVIAGRNVFYVDRGGRYVMVGALLDLNKKVDLTDRRIRELAALTNATAKISPLAPAPAAAASPTTLNVDLDPSSAIVHNPGAPLKLTVFSDLNCGYCRKLFRDLQSAPDIEVAEYPIAILGDDSADKAKMALCADDRAKAANAIYLGGDVQARADCAEGGARLAANMAFAEANGIAGTPALVRADGAVNRGWMSMADLRAWLKAAQS